MLTRPGSPPGPRWMRRWSQALAGGPRDPKGATRHRRWMIGFWTAFALLMLFNSWVHPPLTGVPLRPYRSTAEIAGVPLFCYGEHARGIVAVGSVAIGVVAIGGIAVGGVAVGGVALGGVAIAGVVAGVLALGGLALGVLAAGGGAVGYYALGGLAVGGYAYAGGGVALGYHEASGAQRERLVGSR